MLRSLFLIFIYLCITCDATPFVKCTNKPPPLVVDVHGCAEQTCAVYKGHVAVMDVQFVGNKNDIKRITTKVTAKAFGLNIPYELTEDVANVCSNLLYGAICPIYDSEDVTYRLNFYVEPMFPEITADVTVNLIDQDANPITCFVVSFKIRKGQSLRIDQLLL